MSKPEPYDSLTLPEDETLQESPCHLAAELEVGGWTF